MNLPIPEGFRKEKGLGSRDLGFREEEEEAGVRVFRIAMFEKKTGQQLGFGLFGGLILIWVQCLKM